MNPTDTAASGPSPRPLGNRSSTAATTVKNRIDSVNDAEKNALDKASQKADAVHDDLAPALKHGVDQAQTMMEQGMDALRNAAEALREKAEETTDQMASYTREEPIKALLIAAAVGAGLMGLLGLMRSGD